MYPIANRTSRDSIRATRKGGTKEASKPNAEDSTAMLKVTIGISMNNAYAPSITRSPWPKLTTVVAR